MSISENHSRTAIRVIGAGLAGSEVALTLASFGFDISLLDQKTLRRSPAHHSDLPAELVCSNSFRSDVVSNAAGLLKAELRLCASPLLALTERTRVSAGSALAVDRQKFSQVVSESIHAHANIHFQAEHVEALPEDDMPTVLATGPLTDGELAEQLAALSDANALFFYDAIAPIIDSDGIDTEIVFAQSRYDKGEAEDYLNIPLTIEEYYSFINSLLAAEKVTPRDFEDSVCFEGCLPIEVMAARGVEVLAHGPMKPVGLIDPRSGKQPHAAVQLRKENEAGSARNLVGFQTRMTQGAQRDLIRSLPGMSKVRFQRYGSIHRNSYLNAPQVLDDQLRLKQRPQLRVAGQLAGSEGYIEAIAVGHLVARMLIAEQAGRDFVPPPATTAMGGLYRHLRGHFGHGYTPSNITWAMIQKSSGLRARRKRELRELMAGKALQDLQMWLEDTRDA